LDSAPIFGASFVARYFLKRRISRKTVKISEILKIRDIYEIVFAKNILKISRLEIYI